MFIFIYSEIGELEHNVIVKSAFEKMMFEKLQSEGYCDINPLIGRPRTSKSEIENNLKKLDSPLAKVFAGKYATNTEELEKIMLPVLKELEKKLSKNKTSFDEYNYFALFIPKLSNSFNNSVFLSIMQIVIFLLSSFNRKFDNVLYFLPPYVSSSSPQTINAPS